MEGRRIPSDIDRKMKEIRKKVWGRVPKMWKKKDKIQMEADALVGMPRVS